MGVHPLWQKFQKQIWNILLLVCVLYCFVAVWLGLGRIVVLYDHPSTFSRFSNICDASISKATMRP